MHLFITGTDTGIGKTYFTCWLVRAWQRAGYDAAALKPIASGDRHDALALQEAMNSRLCLADINPYHFATAEAPFFAAREEKREIDFEALNQGILALGERFTHLAVEGAGGWRVPLAPDYEVCDWAFDLGFPVVVVAHGMLGTINHTALTVQSIRASGQTCAGIVVNSGEKNAAGSPDLNLTWSRNVAHLRDLLGLPVFEFDRAAETAGNLPTWLGGE